MDRALEQLQVGDSDLLHALSTVLGKLGGVPLRPADWAPEKLDDFYRMNVRVVDAQGKLLEQGRDLARLVERFRSEASPAASSGPADSPARGGSYNFV